jgi:hypothetical protein
MAMPIMPAEEPPWLNYLLGKMDNKLDTKMDAQEERMKANNAAQEERLKQSNATHLKDMDTRLASKFLEYDTAMIEIAGRCDDMTENIKGESVSRKKEVADLNKKIDDQKRQLAAELIKLQASIGARQPTTTHPPHHPPSAALGKPPSDFDLEISISGIRESKKENLLSKCQEVVFNPLGLNYGQFHVKHCFRAGREPTMSDGDSSDSSSKRRPRRAVVRFTNPSYKELTMKRRNQLRQDGIYKIGRAHV